MRELHYVGRTLPDEQVYGKVTGEITYTSDLSGKGTLYLKCRPSETAHGMIRSIDTAGALKVPGVRKIYTWENTPDRYYDRGRVSISEKDSVPNQEKLFDRHVRYYGERVAAVAADTPEAAEKACRLIRVEYDPLPAVLSPEDAMKEGAPLLHEGGNLYECRGNSWGDYRRAEGEFTFRSKAGCGRITHLSMETSGVRAKYEKGSGKLTIWEGTQTVFGVRSTVADFLEMPYSRVRVIKMPMGGSFGCKQEMILEVLAAYVAKDLCADVKWILTREEQIVNTMMKHSLTAEVESKFRKDGTIVGMSVDMTLDAGAYFTISPSYIRSISGKLGKIYRIPNIRSRGRCVCTNTPVNGSFRSWGTGELNIALETHMNFAAKQLGMDPVELRLKNVLSPGEKEVLHGVTVSNVRFRDVLEKGRDRFEWERRKEDCAKKNREGGRYRYGTGVAVASHTSSFYPYQPDVASCSMRLQDDGSLIVHVPVHDHGCGTVLAMKKIAAEVLQIGPEMITLREADTENMPYDYGCYASRSVYSLGNAVKACAEKLLLLLKENASDMLNCVPSRICYEKGYFHAEGKKRKKLSLSDLWVYALNVRGRDLFCSCTVNAGTNPGTAAAHFVQVRVDTFTGHVDVEKYLAVHDVGKAVNPDLCRGQAGSGIQQGMGIALREEIKIDPATGRTLITNFKNYEVANVCDIPDYEVILVEDSEPTGPFGAKGIGEVVVAPAPAAIAAAVNSALDTELDMLPLTPAVILEALAGK